MEIDGNKRKRENKKSENSRKRKSHKKEKSSIATPTNYSSHHKNLMQLAKLVQAGSLSMPRGLDAYFDDRPSLLDQLFTILTQDDIQGLLPDILKGLKTKKNKELCLRELTKLDDSQLLSIITDTQEEEKEEEKEEEEDKEKRFKSHAIFPKLLCQKAHDFSWGKTSFNKNAEKAGTGRKSACNYARIKFIIVCFIMCYMQVSFFCYTDKETGNYVPYTEDGYLELGRNVAKTFLDYYQLL